MLQPMTDSERRDFREWMGRSLGKVVRDAARIDDPAELELLASELVPPALLLGGPPGAMGELVAMIGEAKGGLPSCGRWPRWLHRRSRCSPPRRPPG